MRQLLSKLFSATPRDDNAGGTSRPLWRSKSLRLALAALLGGSGMWAFGSNDAARPGNARSVEMTSSSQAFSDSATTGTQRLAPDSPALFRFGASLLGGFFLGWAFRRFVKATVLVAGAVIVGIGLLKATGWIHLDWASVEGHVRESFAWVTGKAEAFKTLLTGYLPSAGAGGIGVWRGARWK